jgi:poly(3-hydroxybutyrate) depolymerase
MRFGLLLALSLLLSGAPIAVAVPLKAAKPGQVNKTAGRPVPKKPAKPLPAKPVKPAKPAPFDLRTAVRSWLTGPADRRAALLQEIERRATADQVFQAIGKLEPVAAAKIPKDLRATHNSASGQYLVLLPKGYTHRRSWPLIVALHGKGENQNPSRMCDSYWGGAPAKAGFLMACPALGGGEWWKPQGEKVVMDTVADVLARYNVKANQVSLSGFSAGAMGAWAIGARMPDRFAAMNPRSGKALVDSDLLRNLGTIPIFASHGTADENIAVSGTREVVAGLRKARAFGKSSVYRELKGVAHDFAASLNPSVLRWLAGKKRATPREAKSLDLVVAPDRAAKLVQFLELESSGRQRVHASIAGNDVSIRLSNPASVSKITVYFNRHVVDPGKPVTLRVNGRPFTVAPRGDPELVLKTYAAQHDLRRTFLYRHSVTHNQIADLPADGGAEYGTGR